MFDDVLSWLSYLVNGAFEAITTFIYGLLPDADSTIAAQINSWSYIFSGHDLDFNIYYFLDMNLVIVFLGIWFAVTVTGLLIMAVRFVVDLVHKVLDSIPIIG